MHRDWTQEMEQLNKCKLEQSRNKNESLIQEDISWSRGWMAFVDIMYAQQQQGSEWVNSLKIQNDGLRRKVERRRYRRWDKQIMPSLSDRHECNARKYEESQSCTDWTIKEWIGCDPTSREQSDGTSVWWYLDQRRERRANTSKTWAAFIDLVFVSVFVNSSIYINVVVLFYQPLMSRKRYMSRFCEQLHAQFLLLFQQHHGNDC